MVEYCIIPGGVVRYFLGMLPQENIDYVLLGKHAQVPPGGNASPLPKECSNTLEMNSDGFWMLVEGQTASTKK